MTKLSPTQLAILASAGAREDGLALRPAGLRPAAAAKIVAGLVEKGFAKEIRAKLDAPVWREDEDGRYALKVLKAGRLAAEAQSEASDTPVGKPSRSEEAPSTSGALPASELGKVDVSPDTASPSARGHKRDQVLALLRRPEGATMTDLIAATGWLPHTTRAALSGLRRGGLAIELHKDAGEGASVYRIVAEASGGAAAAA